MNVEMMGVTFVELAIAKTDFLVPHINSNDREPSWDGDVEVYRKAGDTHAKDDLILKVPVQIKGHKENNLKKKTIKYSVDLADLRNYLNAGGTVFMVIYVDEDGDNSQIYYSTLLPFELRRLVSKYGEQKTKQIELKALSKKKSEIADVFLFAATHIKKQRPAISCELLPMDELIKTGHVTGFNIGYTHVPDRKKDPLEYIFDHGTYIYANLPFGLELPVEHISNIEMAETIIEQPVSVKEKVFYSQYQIVHSKSTAEIRFGKSVRLVTDKATEKRSFKFSAAGTLAERINDLDFMSHALDSGCFRVEDKVFSFDSLEIKEQDPLRAEKVKAYLKWLRTIDALLKQLGVADDLDFDKLSASDKDLLMKLIPAVLHNESMEWPELNKNFHDISIANLVIRLCVLPDEKRKNHHRIYGYSNAPVGYKVKREDGNYVEVSYHACLRKESMLNCCNIDYSAIVRQTKTVPDSEENSNALVNLLLEMLRAYDASGSSRNDILDAAIELADWLRTTDTHTVQDLLDLNYYQAIKRSRDFEAKEIQALHSIIEGNPIRQDVYVGAYLLLGDYESAENHFNDMDVQSQKDFMLFPISRYFSESQSHNSL